MTADTFSSLQARRAHLSPAPVTARIIHLPFAAPYPYAPVFFSSSRRTCERAVAKAQSRGDDCQLFEYQNSGFGRYCVVNLSALDDVIAAHARDVYELRKVYNSFAISTPAVNKLLSWIFHPNPYHDCGSKALWRTATNIPYKKRQEQCAAIARRNENSFTY